MADINELKKYATHRQWEFLQAIHKCNGSYREAERMLETSPGTASRSMARLRAAAARQGYAPEYDMTKPVPEGFAVGGISTYYDGEGNVRGQWVKSAADKKAQEVMLREAMEAFCEGIPRAKAVKKLKREGSEQLLNLVTLTDYHLGMYSYAEETGADWDLKIAEDLLTAWILHSVERAPAAHTAVLAQLGDFLHFDSLEAVTPQNRNLLDADTRFSLVVRVAIRALMRVTNELLRTHDFVHVIMAEGNHDPASSVWLREWFAAWFEDEPRVSVARSPDPYYCYEWGLTSLFFHHGHKRGVKSVDDVFVAKFREVFGRTKFSYGHMGHLHFTHVLESQLMIIEQHPTISAPDAYASRGGWMSKRSTNVITYSKEYGEVGRIGVTPEMVQ